MVTQIHTLPIGATEKDWFVARINSGLVETKTNTGFAYIYGGTLKEVKEFIASAEDGTRRFFTWVPREFMLEDLFGLKTY